MAYSQNYGHFHSIKKGVFQNWHRNFKQPLTMFVNAMTSEGIATFEKYNDCTKILQKILAEAMQNGDSVNTVGGAWSFSKVAATDGVLINTPGLNLKFQVDGSVKHPAYSGDISNLCFLQCGNSVAELNEWLKSLGKCLKTTGESNGQTIVGAMSTGAHGSAIHVGSIQDYVKAIHIIISPDTTVWVERENDPIIDDRFVKNTLGAKIMRDDKLFNAALVAFGSFGVIHGVIVEAENLFYLHTTRKRMPFIVTNGIESGMKKTITDLDFSGLTNLPRPFPQNQPYHLKIVIDPRDRKQAAVTVMYKDQQRATDCKSNNPKSTSVQGDNLFAFIATVSDLFPGELVEDTLSSMFKSKYTDFSGVCGTIGEIFTSTTTRGKASSTAIGIPMGRVEEALNIVFRLYDDYWAPVLVALRYVKSSKATLAFTTHGETTCILEIDGPQSRRVATLTNRIWKALGASQIPHTFHWGKLSNLDATTVRSCYGNDRVNRWIEARRTILPTKELRALFTNEFLRQLNMHS